MNGAEIELEEALQKAFEEAGYNTPDLTSTQTMNPTDLASWMDGFSAGMSMWWYWAIAILEIVSMWLIFNKAKKPGWAAIIPIYNAIVMLQVIKKPWWWILLLLVPIVNIVIGVMMTLELSRVFGHGWGYTLGLIFLPFIFYPILAFGPDQYRA